MFLKARVLWIMKFKSFLNRTSLNHSPKWFSPLVCVPKKNGDVHLCVDKRKANTTSIRNYCPIPTLDEILYKVSGAKIFSKLDLA